MSDITPVLRRRRASLLCPTCGAMMYRARLLNGYPKTGREADRMTCALHGPRGAFRHLGSDRVGDDPPMSQHYGKRDPNPDLKPGDLRRGLSMLRTAADRGETWARALLAELDRRQAALDLIPRDARSKHGTHYWTGRNWRERG